MTIADRSDLSQLQAVDDDIDVTHVLEGADDSTLLTMARRGSAVALATLFARYRQPAERYARHLGLGAEADDVVSETFAQILDLLGRAKGPETAFRAYLFTSVRHESARRAKIRQRVISTGEADDLDQPVPFGNGEIDLFERGIVRNAYHSLPERWRAILWQLDVEGRSPREVGENQNMSPNAVSALAYRARSGLRESYLKQHVSDRSILDADCDPVREGMAAVVRGTAPKRMRDRVLGHLESCSSCHGDFEELTEVNRELGAVSAPAIVVATGVTGTAGMSSGLFGWLAALKGQAAAVLIPAVAVGAVTVVPVVVEVQAPSGESVLAAPSLVETILSPSSAVLNQQPSPKSESVHVRPAVSATIAAPKAGSAGVPARVPLARAPLHTTAKTVHRVVHQVVRPVVDSVVAEVEPILKGVDKTVVGLVSTVASVGK